MSERLRVLAKELEGEGHPVAELVFAAAGVAQQFEDQELAVNEPPVEIPISRIEYLARLANALAATNEGDGRVGLTLDVARRVHNSIGHELPNTFPTDHLRIPMMDELPFIDPTLRQSFAQVDSWLKAQYNAAVTPLYERFGTVGMIRRAPNWQISRIDTMGAIRSGFVAAAFSNTPPTNSSQ